MLYHATGCIHWTHNISNLLQVFPRPHENLEIKAYKFNMIPLVFFLLPSLGFHLLNHILIMLVKFWLENPLSVMGRDSENSCCCWVYGQWTLLLGWKEVQTHSWEESYLLAGVEYYCRLHNSSPPLALAWIPYSKVCSATFHADCASSLCVFVLPLLLIEQDRSEHVASAWQRWLLGTLGVLGWSYSFQGPWLSLLIQVLRSLA